MGAADRTIAVIVVNYETAELAIKAVESVLARCHGGRRCKVHLVDNASPGGDAVRLAQVHSERGWGDLVTLWPETENHGFGRGNNVVLDFFAASDDPPDYVFLLNPDASLENEALSILSEALDADYQVGAVGAAMLGRESQPIAAAFRFPTGLREVLRVLNLTLLYNLIPNSRIALPPDQPEGRVDWVTGAAVMFRFTALQETGFFDPGFFLYYEEVELMRRMVGAGWAVMYIPAALVVHEEGAATQVTGVSRYRPSYVYESFHKYHLTTAGYRGALLVALFLVPAALLNILHRRLRGKAPTIPKGFLSDHWRLVLRPLLKMSNLP